VVLLGIAGMSTFDQIGISIAPILATAGVAGIAVGFGAQSLVKDFFSGLFLLIENQVAEGDAVEVAGKSGIVEEITLRHIRLRDQDGSVHFIPNGIVTTVTNKSRA
jgi:small conductance mechanosensitive channel